MKHSEHWLSVIILFTWKKPSQPAFWVLTHRQTPILAETISYTLILSLICWHETIFRRTLSRPWRIYVSKLNCKISWNNKLKEKINCCAHIVLAKHFQQRTSTRQLKYQETIFNNDQGISSPFMRKHLWFLRGGGGRTYPPTSEGC